MLTQTFFKSLTSTPTRRRPTRQRSPASRLFLEALEDRRLLAFNVLAEYATGPNPMDLALAPINADNQLDLLLIENGRVAIRLVNADGSFGEPVVSAGEIFADRAITGDFTNDGVTDLVTSNASQLKVRIGNGDGSFQDPLPLGLPFQWESAITGIGTYDQYVNSLVAGDLNDDGNLDLVVGGTTGFPTGSACGYYSCGYTYSYNGYVNVLLGTGTGSFDYVDADPTDADPNAHRLGNYQVASSLAIDDLNNDGQGDVVVFKFYGGLASLLGEGTGQLQNPVHSGAGAPLSSISLGDVDGDGFLDTVTGSGIDGLTVQKGQGDGRFLPGTPVNTRERADSAVMGDVNGDGKLDLVAAGNSLCNYYGYYGCYDETNTKLAIILLGDGQGGFSLPIASSLGTDNYSSSYLIDLALVELTGDDLLDLVTIDRQQSVILAANDGNWAAPMELAITDVTVVEGDSGSANAVFTVTLIGEPGGPVSVDFVAFDYYYDSGALAAARAGEDYTPQSGTLSFGPGVLSHTITVPVLGDRIGEGNESFFVNLSNPTGALIRDAQGVATIVDNEPSISINHPYGVDPLTVVEGDTGTTPAEFAVTLSRPYDQEVTVDYYTSTGHTDDIVAAAGTLRFAPGETNKTITVQVVGDLVDEPLEAFNVILANPSPNASIANGGGYCYIEDNDPTPPSISIRDVTKAEGNKGQKTLFTFTVTLSASYDQAVTMSFRTVNGTAKTSNGDYIAKTGTLTFAPGETTKTITIEVKGDSKREANETFYLDLFGNSSNSLFTKNRGIGTILNDD
jgi:hypothetical protein